MTRFRANKKLYAVDAEIGALENERRALELRAFGAEVSDTERRDRYFSIEDVAVRRKAIGLDRKLHALRQRQQAAALDYWTKVVADTRTKLEDLRSESPTSAWRRRIWWDVLTILWILGGAGWLAYQIPGAVAGTVATAVSAWFIVRSREGARMTSIRQGEEILRSSESELRNAERNAAPEARIAAVFSDAEERTGTPDAVG